MSAGFVSACGLTKSFGSRTIVREIDLDVAAGEFVALLGRSGTGKTTLLRLLAGLERPDAGTLVVPQPHAIVFQEPRLLPWKRVWQNVAIGLARERARDAAARALDAVGLRARSQAWPGTLSGGEAQRVALARALVREPRLVLLDEPFASLDALTRVQMHALLDDLWRRTRPAIVLVTHDVDEALLLADRIVVLVDGTIAHRFEVAAPRPRDPAHPMAAALRREVLRGLGVVALDSYELSLEPPLEKVRL